LEKEDLAKYIELDELKDQLCEIMKMANEKERVEK